MRQVIPKWYVYTVERNFDQVKSYKVYFDASNLPSSLDRLPVHHRFFCGPRAEKSAALSKTDKKMSRTRKRSIDSASQGAEIKDSSSPHPRQSSPLHKVLWTRIVLDEAHYIKVGLLFSFLIIETNTVICRTGVVILVVLCTLCERPIGGV